MITIKQLNNLRRQYNTGHYCTMVNKTALTVTVWNDYQIKPIGHIKLIQEDGEYYVDSSKCKKKGIGKLLYYHALNMVYPSFVRPDIDGFSNDAMKVWEAMKKANYVESVKDPNFKVIGPKEDNYSDWKYRFTFKN